MPPTSVELLELKVREFPTPYCLDHVLLEEILEEMKPEVPKCLFVGKGAFADLCQWCRHVENFEMTSAPMKRDSPLFKLNGVPGVVQPNLPRNISFLQFEGTPEKTVIIYGRSSLRPYDWVQKSPAPTRPRRGPDIVTFGERCYECRQGLSHARSQR